VLCIFNLSPDKHEVQVSGGGAMALSQGVEHKGERLVLHPNGFAILEAMAHVSVSDVKAERRKTAAAV
jgi:alpha-glucosidase